MRMLTIVLVFGLLLLFGGCTSAEETPLGGLPDLPPPTVHLPIFGITVPPQEMIGFCARHYRQGVLDKNCGGGTTDDPEPIALTPEKWRELNSINRHINASVPEISDWRQYGRSDFWEYPAALGGDCEDIALEKKKILLSKGWPLETLLLATIKDGHAVLLINTTQGVYVLDNKSDDIIGFNESPYEWSKIESPLRPYRWMEFGRKVVHPEPLPKLSEHAPFLDIPTKP